MCFDDGLYIRPDNHLLLSSHTFSYSTNVVSSFLVELSSPTDSSNRLEFRTISWIIAMKTLLELCFPQNGLSKRDVCFCYVYGPVNSSTDSLARTVYAHVIPTNTVGKRLCLPFQHPFHLFLPCLQRNSRMKYLWNAHISYVQSLGHVSIRSCQTHPISMCLYVYVSMRGSCRGREREGGQERGGHKRDYGTIGQVLQLWHLIFSFSKHLQELPARRDCSPTLTSPINSRLRWLGGCATWSQMYRDQAHQAWTTVVPAFDSPKHLLLGSLIQKRKYVSFKSCSPKHNDTSGRSRLSSLRALELVAHVLQFWPCGFKKISDT